MFSEQSRYWAVPDVALARSDGRVVTAKGLRPLPEVTGTFTHTLAAGDRLDQLAYRYYGRPLDYWRICDANPQFLSPLALTGQEAVCTTRFPVTAPAGQQEWSELLAAVSGTVGVEQVTLVDEVAPHSATVTGASSGGPGVPGTAGRTGARAVDECRSWALLVTHNRVTIGADALRLVIAGKGFTAGEPSTAGQLGRPIVIPVAAFGAGPS